METLSLLIFSLENKISTSVALTVIRAEYEKNGLTDRQCLLDLYDCIDQASNGLNSEALGYFQDAANQLLEILV